MILGLSVLELSSGNLLVDGPTDMSKTIYPLFFEGGHKKFMKIKQVREFFSHDCESEISM